MRVFVVLLCPYFLLSQSIFDESLPEHVALSGATVADTTFVSMYTNPSGTVYDKRFKVGIGYSNRFLFQELSVKSIGMVFPFYGRNTLGIACSNYGYSDYSLSKFSLSYARQIGGLFSASLRFNYHLVNLIRSNSMYAFSIDVGLHFALSEEIRLGVHIQNPTLSRYMEKIMRSYPTL